MAPTSLSFCLAKVMKSMALNDVALCLILLGLTIYSMTFMTKVCLFFSITEI
ncbi:hypothetical protein ABMA08_09785 [Pseudomonas yamanorum]